MKGNGLAFRVLLSCALCMCAAAPAFAQNRSLVQDATLTLRLFPEHLQVDGLRLETADAGPQALSGTPAGR